MSCGPRVKISIAGTTCRPASADWAAQRVGVESGLRNVAPRRGDAGAAGFERAHLHPTGGPRPRKADAMIADLRRRLIGVAVGALLALPVAGSLSGSSRG